MKKQDLTKLVQTGIDPDELEDMLDKEEQQTIEQNVPREAELARQRRVVDRKARRRRQEARERKQEKEDDF